MQEETDFNMLYFRGTDDSADGLQGTVPAGDAEGIVALRLLNQLQDQMKAHALYKEQRMISLGWEWTEFGSKESSKNENSADRQRKLNQLPSIQLPMDTPYNDQRFSGESKDNNMYKLSFGNEGNAADHKAGRSFGDMVRNKISDSVSLTQSFENVFSAEHSEQEVRDFF